MHLDFHGLSLRDPLVLYMKNFITLFYCFLTLYCVVIHVANLLLVDTEVVVKLPAIINIYNE